MAKRFLSYFIQPTKKDEHVFDSVTAARRFMIESDKIDVPVFVSNSANYSMIDRDEGAPRPIEQIFELLGDVRADEDIEYDDESKPPKRTSTIGKLGEMREPFEAHNGHVKYPINLPDIPTPTMDHGIPAFLQTGNCTLLQDLMREALNMVPGEVCDCGEASNIPECGHFITMRELLETHQSWRYWPGTTMISEPGTATAPHFDKWAMPTYISCLEGEMGFGWQVRRRSKAQHVERVNPVGRWVFKVLRPGDTVWMPSGIVHFVVRKPQGQQTLGFAGHVMRKQDLCAWLRVLIVELEAADEYRKEEVPYADVVRPLMREVRKLVEAVGAQGREKTFGGKAELTNALKLVARLEKLLVEL